MNFTFGGQGHPKRHAQSQPQPSYRKAPPAKNSSKKKKKGRKNKKPKTQERPDQPEKKVPTLEQQKKKASGLPCHLSSMFVVQNLAKKCKLARVTGRNIYRAHVQHVLQAVTEAL